ncbi:MAG: hypothetical protein AYL33_002410 [Candidatus Bathyarchaeota archaeon B63]|nr:MAG: hypothetical protein AYL33_002410 [Candidatus Bathyarchaeota archaeon B63]
MVGKVRLSKIDVELQNAQMIMGLDGWVNAGKVSTFSVKYLIGKLNAIRLGEIPQGSFHDYAVQRPFVSIREGLMRSYVPPRSIIYYWRGESGPDLIFILGVEPFMDWPGYAEAVLEVAEVMKVHRIYTLGGYLADVSSEDEVLISSSTNNPELIDDLKKINVVLTNYSGPTSIYSEIMWRSKAKKVDVISLWSAVPMHVDGIYPKAAYQMLKKITSLLGLKLDLTDLKKKAESFRGEFGRRIITQTEMRRLIENMRGRREKRPTYIL